MEEVIIKKSKWSVKKMKVNLYQKVCGLRQTKYFIQINYFPIIIRLNNDERLQLTENSLGNFDGLSKHIDDIISYYYEPLYFDETTNYFVIDVNKLEKNFFDNKIYIDRIIHQNDKISYVYNMKKSINEKNIKNETKLGVSTQKNIFKNNHENIKLIRIIDLINELKVNYIEPIASKLDLNQEKIEKIHQKNKITAEEKVKEWEDYGLCAPADTSDTKERCKKFNNCHECLIEYASNQEEYYPIFHKQKTKILKKEIN